MELQDINPPRDIREAMEKQMRAERDRRAHHRCGGQQRAAVPRRNVQQAQITTAEGQKQGQILGPKAMPNRVSAVRKAKPKPSNSSPRPSRAKADPRNYPIAMKYLETLKLR